MNDSLLKVSTSFPQKMEVEKQLTCGVYPVLSEPTKVFHKKAEFSTEFSTISKLCQRN